MTDKHEIGEKIRRKVLGDAHVKRAETARTNFDEPFQDMITQTAWGTVWASERISLRERSLVTLGILAATGNAEELVLHLRATVNTGATRDDIAEVFQHVAIYAGVPRANTAIRIAKQLFAEMDES